MREIAPADHLGRLIKANQVAHPGEDGHVGNGVGIAHHPGLVAQVLIQHPQEALGLVHIAVARAFVFKVFAGKFMEKAQLPQHRPQAAHLPHQPLQRGVALGRVGREKLPGFFGQINQDGPRFKQRQRLAARAVGVEDGGDFVVGIERQKRRVKLVVVLKADGVRLVGQAHFFQRNRHFHAIGRGQRIQLQPLRMLGRPLGGNGVVEQGGGHRGLLGVNRKPLTLHQCPSSQSLQVTPAQLGQGRRPQPQGFVQIGMDAAPVLRHGGVGTV